MNHKLDGCIRNNNLNWIRLILSSFVIVGHSYAIAPVAGAHDVVGAWLGFTYSGSLAVKIFFFVSGLLVCNSLLNNNSSVRYVISRFFRIVPALFVLLSITVFVVGPLVTNLSLSDYFKNKELFAYFFNNLNLFSHAYYNLPGVFHSNPYPDAVNGSLWTLYYEVEMYAFLLVFSMVGLLKRKTLASVVFGFVIILPAIEPSWLFGMYTSSAEVYYLPSCFALGCLAALWKRSITIRVFPLLSLITLTFLLKMISDYHLDITSAYHLIFYVALFYFFMCASDRRVFNIPTLNIDISYGVYIYGFLIQQLVAFCFPSMGYLFNIIMTLAICYPVAYLSCKYVEEPAIRFGRQLVDYFKSKGLVRNTEPS